MRPLLSAVVVLLVSCAAEPEDAPQTQGGGGGASSSSSKATLPLLGGTLAVSLDDEEVLVSDPDRDTLFFVNLSQRAVRTRLKLPDGSTPTRAVDDGAGHWVVTLRGSGKVAIVDQSTRKLVRLVDVCGEPRGVSRALRGGVLVACATGELVSVQASGEVASRFIGVEGRDVIQNQAGTWVSSFRSAELVEVTSTPMPEHPAVSTQQGVSFGAQVAYRTLERSNGDVVMVHQLERLGETTTPIQPPTPVAVPVRTSAYGAPFVAGQPPPPCAGSSMRTGVTIFSATGPRTFEVPGVLPLDAALSADGRQLAIASAANHEVTLVPDLGATTNTVTACGPANRPPPTAEQPATFEQPVGVAFLGNGRLLVHFHSPPVLQVREGLGAIANIDLAPRRRRRPGPSALSRFDGLHLVRVVSPRRARRWPRLDRAGRGASHPVALRWAAGDGPVPLAGRPRHPHQRHGGHLRQPHGRRDARRRHRRRAGDVPRQAAGAEAARGSRQRSARSRRLPQGQLPELPRRCSHGDQLHDERRAWRGVSGAVARRRLPPRPVDARWL
ncbi:MAG: hypothetical protein GQE15_11420, partial [Archangiaceae bacterium]|nr:hypothetical protein [Archangiaceae bacterium]